MTTRTTTHNSESSKTGYTKLTMEQAQRITRAVNDSIAHAISALLDEGVEIGILAGIAVGGVESIAPAVGGLIKCGSSPSLAKAYMVVVEEAPAEMRDVLLTALKCTMAYSMKPEKHEQAPTITDERLDLILNTFPKHPQEIVNDAINTGTDQRSESSS